MAARASRTATLVEMPLRGALAQGGSLGNLQDGFRGGNNAGESDADDNLADQRAFRRKGAPRLGIRGEYQGINNRAVDRRENDFSLLISLDGGAFL